LIIGDNLSKVVLTVESQKQIIEAQALIIYFESKSDLAKIDQVRKIYDGIPLQFYFGP
jgi:hypothetical protein